MRAKKSVLRKLRQISPAEFAVLEMTNDPKAKSKVSRTESETVTSKEAYVWAALMAHVAQNEPGIGADEIVRAALGRSRRQIKDYYRNFPYYVFGTETQTFSQQISPRYMALVLLGFSWAEPSRHILSQITWQKLSRGVRARRGQPTLHLPIVDHASLLHHRASTEEHHKIRDPTHIEAT